MNAKSLLLGLTLFVLSLQQMHAQFTVGTLDRDAYKYWLVDDKYTKDWNVYFAEQEYSGKKVQCGILADSVVAGKTYQVIERTGVDMTADTLLYRQEGNKVFRHTENDGTDILLFDFGLNEGDEFVTHDGETWIVADIDEEYQNWDNTNRKFVLTGKEDGEQKDVWVEDVGSLYTGILTRADLPPTNTPRLLYCRQIEMTSWRFDVNLPSYDAVFFLDGDFRNEEDLYFFESLLMDNSLDGDSLFVEFIGDSLRLYGIMEINMYVYLMESREQDGIINLNRTDVHFGDEYLGHARRWIDIVIPGFEEGEYEVVYEGKSLGKYTCKGKKQPASMFDGNPQWTYVDGEIVVKTIFDENDYPVCEDTTVYVSFYRLYIDGTDKRYGNTYQRLCEDYIDGNLEDGDQSYKGKYILGVHHSELGSAIYANQEMFEECTGVNLNYLSPYHLLDCHDIELYSFLDVGEKYEYETQHSNNFADGEIPWYQIIDKGTETIGNESFDYTDVNCYDIEKYRVYNKLGALNRWWYNPLLVSFAYSPSYIDRHFMYLNTYSENGKVVYTAPEYTGDPEKKHLSKDTYREDPFLIAPLMEDGKVWNYGWWTAAALTTPGVDYTPVPQTYMVEGDTVIDGRSCMKLFSQRDNNEKEFEASYYETAGKVYMVKDGETEGRLVYDFSAKKGDVISVYNCEEDRMEDVTIHDVQTMNVQGRDLKCLFVKGQHDGGCWWLEGIGSSEGFEYNIQKNTPGNTIKISSVYLGDKCLFLAEDDKPSAIEGIITNITDRRTDNAIYDLMGRRLNGVPAKGIYIQNGKKYVR